MKNKKNTFSDFVTTCIIAPGLFIVFATPGLYGQSGQKFSVEGNSLSAGNFLGSTNNQPLLIKVNNALALQINPGGGILINSFSNNGNGIVSFDNTGKLIPVAFPNDATKVFLGNGTWGNVPIPDNYWLLHNNDLYTMTPGNIGIGTDHPLFKVDIAGDVRISENLFVGGGIIITDKVNAASEVNTGKIYAAQELKSASLKADSILMDSTKAFYGESNFRGDVKLKYKLDVTGDVQVNGNFRTAGSLTFGGTKPISYLPASGGNSEINGFAMLPHPLDPADIDLCFMPIIPLNQFTGMIQSFGNNSDGYNNVMSMGFDGSNGIIDMAGTSSNGIAPRLLINYYCGKDIFINSGPHGGNIMLTSSGKIGIGVQAEPAGPKLDINGDVKIRTLNSPSGNYNILVADDNGLIGKKTLADIGDNMGDHTVTQNIKLGNFWLSNAGDDKGLHIDPNGDLTLLLAGVNSFEIKGNSGIPLRRGISLNEDIGGGTGGEFNFWLSLWQDASFNFKGYAADDGSGNTVTRDFMTILRNGNIGCGNTTPLARLHITSSNNAGDPPPSIRLEQTENVEYEPSDDIPAHIESTNWDISNWGGALLFKSNNYNSNDPTTLAFSTKLIISNNGYIGINTNTPHERLEVNGNAIINGNLQINGNYIYSGFVGIGTTCPDEELSVNGKIHVKDEIKVDLNGGWCDYVFDEGYKLISLNDLNCFIRVNKHLPEIPTSDEVNKTGIKLAEMNKLLLKKVEELTLYMIEQDNIIKQQQIDIEQIKASIEGIKNKE